MKHIIILILGVILLTDTLAQSYPDQFTGQWQGELQIYNYRQPQPQKVAMQMTIEAISDSTWQWQTLYLSGDSIISEKNYQLVTIDESDGLYQVDELNGIKLQAQMLAGRLVMFYEVANNLMTVSYFLQHEKMHFEVCFTHKNSMMETGNSAEKTPLVLTYRPGTFQQAILSRHKN